MKATDYTKTMLECNHRIYIDTSALMDVTYLKLLVENTEIALIRMNRKIIVPKAVLLELLRHMDSDNTEKREKATLAFDTICLHRNMFYIEDKDINREQIFKAFADKEILSKLIRNKTLSGQLLITNDKKLGHDAYVLNSQESCLGYKISVCYLSREGQLNACESVNETIKETYEKSPQQEASTVKPAGWKITTLYSIGTLLVGWIIGKYGSKLVQFI